jgi:hypothetical protein
MLNKIKPYIGTIVVVLVVLAVVSRVTALRNLITGSTS